MQCSRSAKLTKYCSWHEASRAFPRLVSAFPVCRWSPPNTRKRTRGRGSWASSLEASRWGYLSDIRLAPFSTTSRGKWPPSSSSLSSSSSPYVRTSSSSSYLSIFFNLTFTSFSFFSQVIRDVRIFFERLGFIFDFFFPLPGLQIFTLDVEMSAEVRRQ